MRFVTILLAAVLVMTAAVEAPADGSTPRAGSRPDGFVDAAAVVPGLVVDMRYAGDHNFVGRRIDGYETPRCILTREAAEALAGAQSELEKFGLGLEVYDCYRPARAVADFVRWAREPSQPGAKSEFYPDVEKSRLFEKGYIAEKSGHSRGSTVDLTLASLPDRTELPMGTSFDLFSERSHPDSPDEPPQVRANRLLLSSVMRRHGFAPYPHEWWHFTLKDEPYPDTYFDFPVR